MEISKELKSYAEIPKGDAKRTSVVEFIISKLNAENEFKARVNKQDKSLKCDRSSDGCLFTWRFL